MKATSKASSIPFISIVAKGRGDGQEFLRLKISGTDEQPRQVILSIDAYLTEPLATIRALRLPLVSGAAQREFQTLVQSALQRAVAFRVATRPGWHRRSFVFPNGDVLGDWAFEVCLPNEARQYGRKFRENGSLEGWQKLPVLARGNTRLMLAIALAFVGPIGPLLRVERVMIQLVGDPGSGKSVIATAAGSVWGCNDDLDLPTFSETWNHTVNNLESVAAPHHATFLALDETKTIDHGNSKLFPVIAKALVRLAEGSTKGRMTDVDDPSNWWMGLLSTSNLSLDEMAAIDHCYIDDAHRTRLIDVPLPPGASGAFECLHGFDDHAALATELLRIARDHYGVASTMFVERLIGWRSRDEAGLRKRLSSCRDHYRREAKRLIASGQRDLARLHEKFATIFAAGALAIKLGILPWSYRELGGALLKCERAHVELVAQASPSHTRSARRPNVRALLNEHVRKHRGEFVDLRKRLLSITQNHDHRACVGYINRGPGRSEEFLFSNEKLLEICGSRGALQQLKRELKAEGALLDGDLRPSVRRTIWANGAREQVIAIRARAFSRHATLPPARQALHSMPNDGEHDPVNTM